MGNKFEVWAWTYRKSMEHEGGNFHYNQVYCGGSFLIMLGTAFYQKVKGIGCVKMEWR